MHHLSLVYALLISATGAIPVEDSPFPGAIKWTPNHQIQPSNVIVSVKGVSYVVKEEAYLAKLKAEGIKIGAPKLDPSWISYNSTNLPKPKYPKVSKGQLGKRDDCDGTFYITTEKTETFVDWDVQMSPVVCAVGDMDISVSSGYSVSNTVGGSAGVDLTFVKDKLAGSLGIDYSRTWTTQTSVITKATIKDGQCGVMITKPLTTRRSGRQFRGCIGSATEIGTCPSGETALQEHVTKPINVIQSPFSQNETNQPSGYKSQRFVGSPFGAHKASYNAQLLSDDQSSGRDIVCSYSGSIMICDSER
ncbi:hypothetical protein FPHYL_3651 [Fusarium phyllophilum]|uniref:Uncharacterized protein n=1 Tax=Fusarium phyllophilum TaxID=47803 RepID=A0A8H5NJP3_9HYPO|nr:hypothetical protein FPHYL_3651 [Fusarium phyllophilum]